jgi:hypothetical protein
MKFKNWRTTLSGIAAVAVYAVGQFVPEYKGVADMVFAALIGMGLLAAKDSNVTGGTVQQ